MFFYSPVISDVVVPMIGVFMSIFVIRFIVGDYGSALSTSDCFYIIKRKATQIANATQRFAFISSAYGLTGIF